MAQTEVLIVGAGPSGLVLALCLHRLGVAVRIVDAASGPGTTSRALVVQARTLELYRTLGLDRQVLDAGHPILALNLWAEGEHRARVELGALGGGLTPHPFVHVYPQDRHEAMLVERLREAGIEVERNCTLLGFEEHGGEVLARLRRASGETETCGALWLVGCDGARSVVRHLIDAGFPGGTYRRCSTWPTSRATARP
ncbi:FAD-dependent monooxygenase [Massilia sp. Se16.2.3]|uniref:FAD-dependent monooxygenase n=1 Tax=Massilia sp. Se16.2.3 TaxID=2709303 RepID=UPI0015FF90F5|nr:FAD-dependent monooxygenase [Massilia sp. Se16.2.3]QNA99872.1 NAD(P)-binding protein [Massilia sp. Se16.2.3]